MEFGKRGSYLKIVKIWVYGYINFYDDWMGY